MTDPVSLKEHLEKLFDVRLKAQKDLIEQAKLNMEQRMEGFPAQFVQKGDVESSLALLSAEVKTLTHAKDQLEGKASQRSVIVALFISALSLLIALGGLLRHFKV